MEMIEVWGSKELLKIVKEAYEQELYLMEKLDSKAKDVTAYISLYFALTGLLLYVLPKVGDTPNFTGGDSIWLLIPAAITLMIAIAGQMWTKMAFLPDAETLMSDMNRYKEGPNSEEDYLQCHILEYDKLIDTLRKTNRFKRICVPLAYGGYFVSLVIFAFVMSGKLFM